MRDHDFEVKRPKVGYEYFNFFLSTKKSMSRNIHLPKAADEIELYYSKDNTLEYIIRIKTLHYS